jgi:hypothetical protein
VAAVMRWRSGGRLAGSSGLMMGVTESPATGGAVRGEVAILVAAPPAGKQDAPRIAPA